MIRSYFLCAIVLAACAVVAQPPQGRPPRPDGPPPGQGRGGPPPPDDHMHLGPPGTWWNQPEMVKQLGLTKDQQKKMQEAFDQYRPQLITLRAALEYADAALDPMLNEKQADDSKALAQIDKVVQARADLEKTRAHMLMAIRHELTPEQLKVLQASDPHPPQRDREGGPPPPRRQQE